METTNEPFNQEIHEILIISLLEANENEHAYNIFKDLQGKGCLLNSETIHKILLSLISDNEVDLAFKLVLDSEKKNILLKPQSYLYLLRKAGRKYMGDAVSFTWKKCVDIYQMNLFEGDCLLVLKTAARCGNPSLAADALRVLDQLGFTMRDFYLDPLLEAFIRSKDIERTLETLHLMRLSGMAKEKYSLDLLSIVLSESSTGSKFTAEAFFEMMHKTRDIYPLAVDTIVLNSLIKSYILSKETRIAIEKTDIWFSLLGVKKNSDTYSILLNGCLLQKNTFAAKQIFDYMVNGSDNVDKIKPNKEAYEFMILISLTQSKYENAFVYLEAMKANGFIPSKHVYSSIVKKCEKHGDSRYAAVIEEMKLFGYPITFGFNRYSGKDYQIPTEN
ncbi:Pentatricopeptide repeat-containing protein [Smittium culicis]|uniref:Pentatricopeptide repeat-containing protein n=1 Tax=Smittium culicis TaxID=133412 RepID=A0A1R1XZM3_9FUNG|nr:Pentatricopeptide repeat-containing protein [Smittium culicis]OMJ20142.1 Pentatricopeptide repeat-containing protein [Smittium culicis]